VKKLIRNSIFLISTMIFLVILNGCGGSRGGSSKVSTPTLTPTPTIIVSPSLMPSITLNPTISPSPTGIPTPTKTPQLVLKELKGEFVYVEDDSCSDKPLLYGDSTKIIKLDYNANSIGFDYGYNFALVKKIVLIPDTTHKINRIIGRSLVIYTSLENIYFTKIASSEWTYNKDENGVITIILNQAYKTRYIKVHCVMDDLDPDGNVLDKSTFVNELGKIIRVYEEVLE